MFTSATDLLADQANNYQDQVVKVMTLGLEHGKLVILAERTLSQSE